MKKPRKQSKSQDTRSEEAPSERKHTDLIKSLCAEVPLPSRMTELMMRGWRADCGFANQEEVDEVVARTLLRRGVNPGSVLNVMRSRTAGGQLPEYADGVFTRALQPRPGTIRCQAWIERVRVRRAGVTVQMKLFDGDRSGDRVEVHVIRYCDGFAACLDSLLSAAHSMGTAVDLDATDIRELETTLAQVEDSKILVEVSCAPTESGLDSHFISGMMHATLTCSHHDSPHQLLARVEFITRQDEAINEWGAS